MKTLQIALAIALAACLSQGARADAPIATMTATAANTQYGAAMPAQPASVALSAVMQAPEPTLGKPIKLSGRVGKVCQAKGCWMMLTDGDVAVRVAFGKDAFFIPKDAQGDAVVFGTLSVEENSLDIAKHLAEDAGIDPATVTAPTKEYSVNASSVVLVAPAGTP
jgi:glucose/arabinose dehydrogenase